MDINLKWSPATVRSTLHQWQSLNWRDCRMLHDLEEEENDFQNTDRDSLEKIRDRATNLPQPTMVSGFSDISTNSFEGMPILKNLQKNYLMILGLKQN